MSFTQSGPDIARENPALGQRIDLVGIRDLRLPVQLSKKLKVSARLSLWVSLKDESARGIHMSRLYLSLHEYFAKHVVSFSGLKRLLLKGVKSQGGISDSGRLRLESGLPVLRKALKSSISGWREYPFHFEVNYNSKESPSSFEYIAGGEILYSSTCPCSASLSLQIIKKDFEKHFKGKTQIQKKEALAWLSKRGFLPATPHAQKSSLLFNLKLRESSKDSFSLLSFIDDMEKALGTPVQTAVKREDEAEFARLNSANLMFCEDSARRAGSLLQKRKDFLDYSVRVRHYESLHPFTVESLMVKGEKGGFRA